MSALRGRWFGVGAIVALAAVLCAPASMVRASPADPVLVFAAASLKTALDEMTPALERACGVTLRTSYAASSALARQIEAGAPADLFVSADGDWME